MKRWLILVLLIPCYANASWWQDLWQTKDQQGKVLLSKGDPKKASRTFKRKDWQSVAHYRAGQYKQAAKLLSSLTPSLTRYYNEGNALAHTGQYEKAIDAYNRALKIAPKDSDTIYNKKIVEALLKQQQEEQKKQQEDQQNNMNNQDQQKQQGGQDQQQQQQSQPQEDNKPSQAENKNKGKKENQRDKKQNANNNENQNKKQNSQQANQQNKNQTKAPRLSANEKEQQQAQMQRLKRIPDDPGGLLRQKFIRDYIRRHPERW